MAGSARRDAIQHCCCDALATSQMGRAGGKAQMARAGGGPKQEKQEHWRGQEGKGKQRRGGKGGVKSRNAADRNPWPPSAWRGQGHRAPAVINGVAHPCTFMRAVAALLDACVAIRRRHASAAQDADGFHRYDRVCRTNDCLVHGHSNPRRVMEFGICCATTATVSLYRCASMHVYASGCCKKKLLHSALKQRQVPRQINAAVQRAPHSTWHSSVGRACEAPSCPFRGQGGNPCPNNDTGGPLGGVMVSGRRLPFATPPGTRGGGRRALPLPPPAAAPHIRTCYMLGESFF